MDRLVKFGLGPTQYDFASASVIQLGISPRFGSVSIASKSIPGLDGEWINTGRNRAPSSRSTIEAEFVLIGDGSYTDMTALKDPLYAMLGWGEQRLFKTTESGLLLWTWGMCEAIDMQESGENLSYIWQRFKVRFKCRTARWYGKTGMTFLDDGNGLDIGLTLPAAKIDAQTVVDDEVIQITNNGNAPAGAYIWFEAPPGETVTNPQLSRLALDGVNLADSITYTDTLNGGDVIVLDARNHEVQENAIVLSGGYENVDALRATWLEIPSGTHDITVNGTFSNGLILTLDCWDVYY